MNTAGDDEGAYAPHPTDSDMVYFEVRKTVRGARWKSVDWEQGCIDPTTGTWTTDLPTKTQIVVLARVGDSPHWGTAQPVMWNAVPAGSGRVIYKFDAPKTDPDDPDQNKIDAVGDTITIRVFFKFLPDYYDTRSWQVPVLRSLSVKYEANPMVLESQELSY